MNDNYIENEDYEKINGKSLCCNSAGYVMIWDKKAQYLHRWIFSLDTGDKEIVDHIDGNKLNLTRENLRLCTYSDNMQNRKKLLNFTSKYKGVKKLMRDDKTFWTATAQKENKRYALGTFETENEAAEAYNIKTKELYNNGYALLNIIV